MPIRFRTDKQLVSHDTHNNTYNYKYTFSVEIIPVCKVGQGQGGVVGGEAEGESSVYSEGGWGRAGSDARRFFTGALLSRQVAIGNWGFTVLVVHLSRMEALAPCQWRDEGRCAAAPYEAVQRR